MNYYTAYVLYFLKIYMDFSVIIPTFNRSRLLKRAIQSVLLQKEVSFEIVVGDNYSTDDTEKIVKSFKDSRIKYFKNKKNLGFAGNIRKCLKRAQGKYIFTLGDDDLILKEDTFFEVLKVMKKSKSGMGSIGTIYFADSPKLPCKIFNLSDKVVVVKPRKDKKLPVRVLDFNISFFTGLIFDKSLIDIDKITKSFTYAYFPFCYDVILKGGIIYIPNYFTIGHISLRFVPEYYSLERLGSFFMEDYLKMIKDFMTGEDYKKYKSRFLRESTILLPSIKLFTNNKNYTRVLQRLINLDKALLIDPKFILLALCGFMPKFILKLLRDFMIYILEIRTIQFVKKYDYFKKLGGLVS